MPNPERRSCATRMHYNKQNARRTAQGPNSTCTQHGKCILSPKSEVGPSDYDREIGLTYTSLLTQGYYDLQNECTLDKSNESERFGVSCRSFSFMAIAVKQRWEWWVGRNSLSALCDRCQSSSRFVALARSRF